MAELRVRPARALPSPAADILDSAARAITMSIKRFLDGAGSGGNAMRSRFIHMLCVVAALMSTAGGAAAQGGGSYTTLAYGGIKCSVWASARSSKPNEAAVYEAWILGFLSAYNALAYKGPNIAAGFDFDALRGMVDGFCKEKPQEDLDAAAQFLIKTLLEKNPG